MSWYEVLRTGMRLYENTILLYFSVLALMYALFGYLGMRSVILYARNQSALALKDLLERDFYKPVSILVPAYNEDRSIVASVRSLLALQFPQFEIVVANDGSTDRTLAELVEAFSLVELPQIYRQSLQTEQVRCVYRSSSHPNLVVVDKENGGKSDTINAAFNVARFPLVCVVDADSVVDAEALIRATRQMVQDETVVAVGGTIRPLNGATMVDGKVDELHAPRTWMERVQVLEYARAFFTGRAAWSQYGALTVISGAFGLYRRDAVLAVGGWWTGTVTDDIEMVVRLHHHFRDRKTPYRIIFTPDPICWTEVPSDFRSLARQRSRWHVGMMETLWRHRRMMFNPRYGRVGSVAMPYLLVFEALAAPLEALGYIYLPVTAAMGMLNVRFAVLFLILGVLYGILLSELAMGIETMLLSRYKRGRDRWLLFAAAFVEFLGYRQALTLVRAVATFSFRTSRGHRQWDLKREGIMAAPLQSLGTTTTVVEPGPASPTATPATGG